MIVIENEDLTGNKFYSNNSREWTALIPAAGRGSRLGYDLPKILYPINGKSILEHLVEKISNYCEKFVFILSPEGEKVIRAHLEELLPGRFEIRIQETPEGMADAILQAKDVIKTKNTFIIWGDQVCIESQTIKIATSLHEEHNVSLSIPTFTKYDPYIHFARDEKQQLIEVLQKREGDDMPEVGESDCGVFLCSTKALFQTLNEYWNNSAVKGKLTQEKNFLPFLPFFQELGNETATFRIISNKETLGINDQKDVILAEKYLKNQHKGLSSYHEIEVLIFCGGRGATNLIESIGKHPQIKLTMVVNAYDDGLSTGRLRKFIPGMLGPSDVRKNMGHIMKLGSVSQKALNTITDYRFPDGFLYNDAVKVFNEFKNYNWVLIQDLAPYFDQLPFFKLRKMASYIDTFLEYLYEQKSIGIEFDFGDCSFGNILFAGCFLQSNDFNKCITDYGMFSGVDDQVLNVTRGENYVLVGLRTDGRYLIDESEIVSPNPENILEVFLLEDYLTESELKELNSKDIEGKLKYLKEREKTPELNPDVRERVMSADVIIYGPGTQHSSLYPTYVTKNLVESVSLNRNAEKVFISNIIKDNDIAQETLNSLVNKFLYYSTNKAKEDFLNTNIVSSFFFQTPKDVSDRLDFDSKTFSFPTNSIKWMDWEIKNGKHAQSLLSDEIMAIIQSKSSKKLKSHHHLVSIVVPALNEERSVQKVLHKLNLLNFFDYGLDKEIIFVDGGSTDNTFELAQREDGVKCFQLKGKKGRGEALSLGVSNSKGNIIVFFPSDDEYNVEEIYNIISPILNNETKAVLGSRAIKCLNIDRRIMDIYDGNIISYFISKYGGMILSISSLLLFNKYVSDTLTTFKAFEGKLLKEMKVNSSGVDYDLELIAKLSKKGEHILEIPVSYRPRHKNEGKKITIFDGFSAIWALVNEKFFKKSRNI
ncbi:MAG: glycosyltransferase [Bacteriovoracaceae bacterium]|jgi:2-phospho-L-lactate transferase/gluconeogenesis factor (CofD/UPF0052 family)/molybdopterin-guanine dinucleotide biosynthesis protein A|nr:glycosyltransferase [Bacteriovoracaceae bacterium]